MLDKEVLLRNIDEMTPLHIAASYGRIEIARLCVILERILKHTVIMVIGHCKL